MKDLAFAIWGSWTQSDTAESLDVSNHEMVEFDGALVGCSATRLDREALHLLRFYIAPNVRNQGIGSEVLNQVIARARSMSLPVRLRVLVNNPAVRFYTRHGFRKDTETDTHIYMIHGLARPIREASP